MKRTTKRLSINSDTIRVLGIRTLGDVRGGMRDISDIVGGCTPGTTGNDTEDCPPTYRPTQWNC